MLNWLVGDRGVSCRSRLVWFCCVKFFLLNCYNKDARGGTCLMVFYLVCQCAWYSLLGPAGLLNASQDSAFDA